MPVPPPVTEEDEQITCIAEAGTVLQLASVLLLAATVMFQVLALFPPVICQDKTTATVPVESGVVAEKETAEGIAVMVPTEPCNRLTEMGINRMRVINCTLLLRHITKH